ncbi:MAG TPA: lipoyl synthase [Myxococcota bacterium]
MQRTRNNSARAPGRAAPGAPAGAPGQGANARATAAPRLPRHCVRAAPRTPEASALQRTLRASQLASVCEEARCPNRGECWSKGHVTFMLLGRVCTRACRFCAVRTGLPASAPDPEEPQRVARAAARLALTHVVLTSVNRDDLPDGGAEHFAATLRAIRAECSGVSTEVLTPDFRGDLGAVATVCEAAPDVFNHNVETVPRLYRSVRPGASLRRSLAVLSEAKRLRSGAPVKSGFMVGLGERREEVGELLRALRSAGVDSVSVGQYLRPSLAHLPVARYWEPREFDALADEARALGFRQVASGPLVRSSFNAVRAFEELSAGRPPAGGRDLRP